MPTQTHDAVDLALAKVDRAKEWSNDRIIGARHNLNIVWIALFTPRGHTFIYGRPGTAKSMLFDITLQHFPDMRVFKTPAFKGSPPEQFLGTISLQAMTDPDRERYERIVTGKFPWAEYVFVDELMRAPRAVLPVFQTGMSDNLMDNGSGMERIPLRAMFGATNSLIEAGDDDLEAFNDRFVFKLVQEPVQSQDGFVSIMRGFLDRRANTTTGDYTVPDDLLLSRGDVDLLTEASARMPVSDGALEGLAQLRSNLLGDGIEPSVRRSTGLLAAMQTDALLRGQSEVLVDNLQIASDALWTDFDERDQVARRVLEFASKWDQDARALADEFDPLRAELIKLQAEVAQTGAANITTDMTNTALRLLRNHGLLRPRIEAHIAEAMGRDTSLLDGLITEMDTTRKWIEEKIAGGLPLG